VIRPKDLLVRGTFIFHTYFFNCCNHFAVIKNGDECTCYEELPLAKMQMVSSEKESNVCNMTCNGNSNYICGGPNAVSVFVASKVTSQIHLQSGILIIAFLFN
jgi:hypothetical protein